ncbi:hypothetical protein F441_13419 [Phytophthora nicotianae CJ01A1]|uniref:Uncharacterized protein n=2 Tax=Phytophthora nicotianae TaxID=4792 RepID=W2WLQ6_PHYNI|nr:hypothetical protein L915_13177 [Phytophthora nicotianae]ETP11068.1 hypothetical protein F441_13419 [Phytophthora nicotianae CJ01A1]
MPVNGQHHPIVRLTLGLLFSSQLPKMSFSAKEEAAMPSLEEVVAFIDSWDSGNTSPGDVTTSESETDRSPFSKEDVDSVLLDSLDGVLQDASFLPKETLERNSKKPMKKKRKKTPGASTRLQRRKRAEILALSALSEQLEGRLEQLRRDQDEFDPSSMLLTQGGSSWSAIAAIQFQERLQSEVINQRLRAVLTEQMKINKALCDVFRAQTFLGNLNVFFGEPGPPVQYPVADNSCAMIGELEKKVEGLYLDSAAVFQPRGVPCINTTLHVKQEQDRGNVFEITSTTCLPCSVQETSAMFWRDFLTIHQTNDKSYHFVRSSCRAASLVIFVFNFIFFVQLRQRKPASVEKSFKWVLRSEATVREINGFAFVRKIEEPNRVVLVEADRFVLPTEGLHFRIQRWTIITRSEDGSRPGSIVRTLIQLRAEYTEEFAPTKNDLQQVKDLVLGTLSSRLRGYLQQQQGKFEREAEQLRMTTTAN